jgi:hypothetical protein
LLVRIPSSFGGLKRQTARKQTCQGLAKTNVKYTARKSTSSIGFKQSEQDFVEIVSPPIRKPTARKSTTNTNIQNVNTTKELCPSIVELDSSNETLEGNLI